MAKLLLSFFKENRLVKFSTGPEKSPESTSQDIETNEEILALTDLSKESGERIKAADLSLKLSELTDEFTLSGNEIIFKILDPNNQEDKGQIRSFIFKEKSIFAKELKTAIEEANIEKIRYLCYKYLRDLYLNTPKNAKNLNKKKYGKSNIILQKHITEYEAKANELIKAKKTDSSKKIDITPQYVSKQKQETKSQKEQYDTSSLTPEQISQIEAEDLEALKKAKSGDFDEHTYYEDEPLRRFDKEEIIQNYDNLKGSMGVTNTLKNRFPEINKNKAAEIVAEIIYARAADNFFTDEHIYDTLKESKLLNYKEDFEEFANKIQSLEVNSGDPKVQDFLFIRELSEKLKVLVYDKKAVESSENLDGLKEEYSEADKKIIQNLHTLFNFSETENGEWEKFIAIIGGVKKGDNITMRDMNGKDCFLSEGMFKSHTNTEAAIKILLNDKNLYELDSNNNKRIVWYKLEDKINDLIKKGYAQSLMPKYSTEEEFNKFIASTEFKNKMAANRIFGLANLKEFTDDQKKYLQIGYLVDQSSMASREENEATEVIKEYVPKYLEEFETKLKAQNVPPQIIEEVKNKLLLQMGTTAKFVNGKFEELKGFGIGTSIELADGFSLGLGLGGEDRRSIEAGAGINITLYKDKNTVVSYGLGLTSGQSLGEALQFETGGKDASVGAGIGIGFNFKTGTLMVGGNLEFTFKIGGNLGKNVEKAKEESPYFEAFEKFKQTGNIEEKYLLLQQIPGIRKTMEAYQSTFGLTNADVVLMIEAMEEQIITDAIEDTSILDSYLPLVHKIGVAYVAGMLPIPYISFYIGTAEVFVPNRKSIAHLDEIRRVRQFGQDLEMENAIKEAQIIDKNSPQKPVFSESVKELTYTVDGKLAVIKEQKEVNFKTISNRIDSFNNELKAVEMSMQSKNGKIELQIHNTSDKDVDMFIDPTLTNLAIIKDGNKFCLEGNIEDLVITRDRLNLPFKENENSSNVRDVITIRKSGSLKEDRSRDWIAMQDKGQYISKKEGQGYALREIGTERGGAWRQKNILEIKGYLDQPTYNEEVDANGMSGLTASEANAYEFAKERSAKFKEKTPEELQENQELEALRDRAISSVERTDYEQKFSIRDGLYKTIQNKMDIKTKEGKDFYDKIGLNIDNTDALIEIITKEGFLTPPLTKNEITEVISIMQDEYFSQIFESKYDTMERATVNKDLAKRLRIRVKDTFLPVLEKDFEDTLLNMGKNDAEAERLSKQFAAQVIKDTVENLIFQLENDEDFDFRQSSVDKIVAGSVFYSVTRRRKGEYVSTTTQNKRTPDNTIYIIETGILKTAQKKYDTSSEIGRVLLEMLSPTENLTDKDYLQSPLVLKLMSLDSSKELLGTENYRIILELMESPEFLDNAKPDAKISEALTFLKNLIERLRKAEISGQTVKKRGPNGTIIEADLTGQITAGAFSKCVNSSFLLMENLEIRIYDSEDKIIARDSTTHETTSADQGLVAASIAGGVAFESVEKNEEERRTPKQEEESYEHPDTETTKSGEQKQEAGANANNTNPTVGIKK